MGTGHSLKKGCLEQVVVCPGEVTLSEHRVLFAICYRPALARSSGSSPVECLRYDLSDCRGHHFQSAAMNSERESDDDRVACVKGSQRRVARGHEECAQG